jgi:hypothetical protein
MAVCTSVVETSMSLEERTTAWSDDSAEPWPGLAFRGIVLLYSISHMTSSVVFILQLLVANIQ